MCLAGARTRLSYVGIRGLVVRIGIRTTIACSLVLVTAACGSGTGAGSTTTALATDTPAQRTAIGAAYEASREAAARWVTRTKGCIAKARSGQFATPGEATQCINTAYDGSHVERRLAVLEAKLTATSATLAEGACRTATSHWITTFPSFVRALRLVHAHDADLDQLSSADVKVFRQLARPFDAARRGYLASC